MKTLRDDAIAIWKAGVDAVHARSLVAQQVFVTDDELTIDDQCWQRSDYDRVIVVGAGKAATAMAAGLLESIGSWLPVIGWINVPAGTERELPGIHVHVGRPAGINEPHSDGVAGTQQILRLIQHAGKRDLCIALISGGGSALMPAPADGITLADKLAVTRWLGDHGADITELNTVRKHLSRVKGGGLLRACRATEFITLILSDVLGDPLELIASGPTVADTSTPADALGVLNRYDPDRQLPISVYDRLSLPARVPVEYPGDEPVTHYFVIGNNALAVDEAGICAERLGYNHAMQSARQSEGTAETVGRHLAEMVVSMLRTPTAHPTNCLITGGEPTVQLVAAHKRGRGGRNQQLVLAAYQQLLAHQLTDQEWQRVAILSGGTDGEDGPTDAAGAFIDANIHRAAQQLALDIDDYLARNDAYYFFQLTEGLLLVGPTDTNVCDVRIALVAN